MICRYCGQPIERDDEHKTAHGYVHVHSGVQFCDADNPGWDKVANPEEVAMRSMGIGMGEEPEMIKGSEEEQREKDALKRALHGDEETHYVGDGHNHDDPEQQQIPGHDWDADQKQRAESVQRHPSSEKYGDLPDKEWEDQSEDALATDINDLNKRNREIFEKAERDGVPTFVLVAKDVFALPAVNDYIERVEEAEHSVKFSTLLSSAWEVWRRWRSNNPDKIKLPD